MTVLDTSVRDRDLHGDGDSTKTTAILR